MSPVRAPLSTLLGLLLVRWLLACSQRLLVRLAPPDSEVQDPEDDAVSDDIVSTSWQSRTAQSLRRYSQRQRARYVKWRETDTAELAEQLRAQCDSLREGIVVAPEVKASVAKESSNSRSNDWADKVRRRGAGLVVPSVKPPNSPARSVATRPSHQQADTPLENDRQFQEPLSNTQARALTTDSAVTPMVHSHETGPGVDVEGRVKTSKQRPSVIPVASQPRVDARLSAVETNATVAQTLTSVESTRQAARPAVTQPAIDTTRWPKTPGRTTVRPTDRVAAVERSYSMRKPEPLLPDSWPALPEECSSSDAGTTNQCAPQNFNEPVANRWPSLAEPDVSTPARSAKTCLRTARPEAEQSGLLWNE